LTATTTYRLVVASGGCPADTTNTIEITVKPAAIGGSISSDTSFCKGPNNGILNLIGYFGNIKGWQQSIDGSGFTNIIPPVVVDSLIYNNVDTTITYRVILGYRDCPDDTSSTATITILKTPVTEITADGPTEFCEPGQVILTATGGPGYLWSTSETTDEITVAATGNYIVQVTDTVTGCMDVDSIPVNVFPIPLVDAGANVVIIEGQSTTLNATGATSYEWSPKSGLSDGFVSNPVASPTDSTLYYVVGIDSNGCIGDDSVLVAVIPGESEAPPEFTNLFTPNGDGHNDYWNITTLANCSTCKVAMYNRYGQTVLQDDNYQNDWEGTFNGANLPDGTYYYVIETETGKIYKGAITILRGK
jgi:gliding motility-associated-like protein